MCAEENTRVTLPVLVNATRARPPLRGFDPEVFLRETGLGRTSVQLKKNQVLFSQGDPADAVFFIQKGSIKLTVVSHHGKEATLALLTTGNFVGESCVAQSDQMRTSTATAFASTTLLRIDKQEMARVLHEEHALVDVFVAFLLDRNSRIQADLVDQLFNSTEKRLARVLLLLAQFGKPTQNENVIPKISQRVLAEMVGTTRSRVNFFLNRFRKLGYIRYEDRLQVHPSLLNVILHD